MKRRDKAAIVLPLVLLTSAACGLGAACSTSADQDVFDDDETTGGGQGGSGAGTTTGPGGSGEGGSIFGDAGTTAPIAISPVNPILKVEVPLAAQSIQFQCLDTQSNLPVPAVWSLSAPDLGTISNAGLFTPNGQRTGEVEVACQYGELKVDTKLTILIHAVDNLGGLPQQTIDVLKNPAPGQPDASWTFLYPYDKTVFPRGILAPEIHLTQGTAPGTAYYVNIVAPKFEYEGFFSQGAANTQLQMSQAAWDALTNSAGGSTVEVRVSKLYNGLKYGPIFRQWILAKGKLHGTIYYNTYDSPLAGDGAMMRIKGNSPTPEVLVGQCTVCHSVSSDGSTAAAANHSGAGGTFDLTGGFVNPPIVWKDSERAAFAGLYPNGSVLVVNGAPGNSWPPNTPGTSATWTSELRTKNGTVIPNSGIESLYAQSPVFSHDGTLLAFTDRQGQQPWASTLSLMAYDAATQKFGDYQVLATPQPGRHLSWPAFTPDSQFVVYQDGEGDDLATWSGNTGKLFVVNVKTKQVAYLLNANGDGYVPQGPRDENKNYEPTMAPVASGGYYWVMFTSRRTFGNKLTGSEGETKRLWVSALDINIKDGVDPSHPAFYVPGQELTSGNSRGFWALDPCKQDGSACEAGDECCNGFCSPKGDPPTYVCAPPSGDCANEFDTCKTAADCCDGKQLQCINGKCTYVPPG